jgi:anti-sigma factor RsiW
MTEPDSYNSTDEAYEQLVAYLDGELDTESSLQVERRLAEDVAYRRELKQLQRAWDMLDELPKSEVSETFTQTTVEMVALSAERDLQSEKKRGKHVNRLLWAVVGGGVVIATVASYLLFTMAFSRENEKLVRDLPVIEKVDLYEVADSVEFLRRLDEERFFEEEVEDAL